MDYFDLFDLPKSVFIDIKKLEAKYLQLQLLYHPDIVDSDKNLNLAIDINLGYRVLKNDMERVGYLLSIMGINLDDYRHKISPTFLNYVMQETEVIGEETNKTTLSAIMRSKNAELKQVLENVNSLFQQEMIDDMILEFIKYKYISNLVLLIKVKGG